MKSACERIKSIGLTILSRSRITQNQKLCLPQLMLITSASGPFVNESHGQENKSN